MTDKGDELCREVLAQIGEDGFKERQRLHKRTIARLIVFWLIVWGSIAGMLWRVG